MILKSDLILKSFYMIIKQQSKIKEIGGRCTKLNDAVQTLSGHPVFLWYA